MAKRNPNQASDETIEEALAIAKKTQKQGQSKEQTRLIAQGIQKGIAEYKKTAKAKQRQADQAKKKLQKQKEAQKQQEQTINAEPISNKNNPLPWGLLIASWLIFALYIFYSK